MSDMNSRNVQEKYFPPKKIQGILKKNQDIYYKIDH